MPLLSRVEKRSVGGRWLLGAAYLLLCIGAIVTVYPFLLMLSASVASSADAGELRVVPRYFYSDSALFAKYVDEKYQGDLETLSMLYRREITDLQHLTLPPPTPGNRETVERWHTFVRTLPASWQQPGFRGYATHPSRLRLTYQAWARQRFGDNIAVYNRTYTEQAPGFLSVTPPMERPTSRLWIADDTPKIRDYTAWKRSLPGDRLIVTGMEPVWARYLREEVYEGNPVAMRAIWHIARFEEVPLSFAPPSDTAQRRDWEGFVRTRLPIRHVAIAPDARPQIIGLYKSYLRDRHPADTSRWNGIATLPDPLTVRGGLRLDWSEFLAKVAPITVLRADTPENRYRDFLAKQNSGGVATANPPYEADDANFVRAHLATLRSDYLWRNYAMVLDYVLLHGRSIWVTVLFCTASVVAALIVNPFCAYALSRFDLRRGYQILLFLLATMAFPAEVTMIPSFLMLKEMGMLNTFWALVLPGVANGYAVFLLKGFFDSLPKELYEAGMLDGASETTMFWHITLPMSGSILAVIALQAFLSAYGAFMFALVVCQDSRMWTIMVWLYQLQASSPRYVVMAALTVAAVPTLLVFLFAQKVILRGILVPVEK